MEGVPGGPWGPSGPGTLPLPLQQSLPPPPPPALLLFPASVLLPGYLFSSSSLAQGQSWQVLTKSNPSTLEELGLRRGKELA